METMTMSAPHRSLQQRMDALARGNEIRTYRATLKQDVKAKRVSVVLLLLSDDPRLDTMKTFDLLKATPKYGRVKANKALKECGISPSKTLGGLTERQRRELAALLGGTMV